MALYMVIEQFRNGDASPLYRRFKEHGRLAPAGVNYISSGVTADLSTCYQVMETADRSLLEAWISHWSDLVEFEVHSVITSEAAAMRMPPKVGA